MANTNIIHAISLDNSITQRTANTQATLEPVIQEIAQKNSFMLHEQDQGPYHMHLSIIENRLSMDIRCSNSTVLCSILVPFPPLRRIIKDYTIVCDSYHQAINSAYDTSKIETIDMGRRGLHNEGADMVREYIEDKAEIDYETSRKLFTIIYLLHLRH